MTPTTIALSLAAIALLFVVAPLLRGKGSVSRDEHDVRRSARRGDSPVESALPDLLEELELDRAMGKLSEDDFERMRRGIELQRAASAPAEPSVTADDRREATPDSPAERAEAMIRAMRADVVACARCGARPEPAARFCSRCGSPIAA